MTEIEKPSPKFEEIERRIRLVLPAQYQDRYDDVQPTSMGSASLRYGADGKVAWDRIWGSFCDLAMAGGPPHRGTLLEPGREDEITADPKQYQQVVQEICRGIAMVTRLPAEPAPIHGWIRIYCVGPAMSGWLARALLTENIAAIAKGTLLYVPAGAHYRIEKEIKNVITSVAKCCHYWLEHIPPEQHLKIRHLFQAMDAESPFLTPPYMDGDLAAGDQERLCSKVAEAIRTRTRMEDRCHASYVWLGLQCGTVRASVWMMRTLIVLNVCARREHSQVFLPVNAASDSTGDRVVEAFTSACEFAVARKIF